MRASAIVCLVAVLAGTARADDVDDRIRELGNTDYKVRLSAVATLAHSRDSRVITPLLRVLDGDGERAVRGAAAIALGKVLGPTSSSRDLALAAKALRRAAKRDAAPFVRKRAAKAYARIAPLVPRPNPVPPGARPNPKPPPVVTGATTPRSSGIATE